jgi:hypothetical protein
MQRTWIHVGVDHATSPGGLLGGDLGQIAGRGGNPVGVLARGGNLPVGYDDRRRNGASVICRLLGGFLQAY